jgi:hypothetical protein
MVGVKAKLHAFLTMVLDRGVSAGIHAPAYSTLATAPIVSVFSCSVQFLGLRLQRVKFSVITFSEP